MSINFNPIGIIQTPFQTIEGMPIQPAGADGAPGQVEVFPEYQAGLKDLDGFSHIYLLYHLHQARFQELTVTPFLDSTPRGLFATRAPKRPNPIGLSVVQLTKIEEGMIHVLNVDMLDGTPLLDIKPYIPEFDHYPVTSTGWYQKAKGKVHQTRSDDRFK